MSHTNNIHPFLSTKSYNSEEIRNIIELDDSSINEKDIETLLIQVLMDSKCSIDIIRLLLQHGADVNVKNPYTNTPLLIAVQYSRDVAIIEALLEKVANIEDLDYLGRTILRYIFGNCPRFKHTGNIEWKENVLNLLLEKGFDLNKADAMFRRPPLCFALGDRADVGDIKLLLNKGASLNACPKHRSSALSCLVFESNRGDMMLKADVIQLLLDRQACKGEVFEMDLMYNIVHILKNCSYETAAMRLLLEHLDANVVNTWIQRESDLLHFVVSNTNSKISNVNFFLQLGVCIDKLKANGESVLYSALNSYECNPRIIEFLLKSGAPVNVNCKPSKNPLIIAVKKDMGSYIINLLLAFGAKFRISLFKEAMYRSSCNQKMCVLKTLVKYYFLEFPGFKIKNLIRYGFKVKSLIKYDIDFKSLSVFAAKCADELQRMESKNVRSDCTLRRFISENSLLAVKTDREIKVAHDVRNQLLKILSSNEFPEYFDVIVSKMLASKVRGFLKKKLQELIIYAVAHCPIEGCLKKKVVLNNDCVLKLARFLSDEELLCLIVAFYLEGDLTYSSNSPKKRDLDSEQFTKFKKHRKLNQ